MPEICVQGEGRGEGNIGVDKSCRTVIGRLPFFSDVSVAQIQRAYSRPNRETGFTLWDGAIMRKCIYNKPRRFVCTFTSEYIQQIMR